MRAAHSDSARLFLALSPSEAFQSALSQHVQQWDWNAQATRYAPVDWHLTLHFIGSVTRERLDELRAGLRVPLQPFELHFGQAELWPHGIAVLLPASIPDELQRLHTRLGQALQRLNLKTETRPYRPHLTLARQAQDAWPPLPVANLHWPVAGYALMESTGQTTPRYRVLQAYGTDGDLPPTVAPLPTITP